MGSISRDFSYCEFERSDTARSKGIQNTVTTFEVRDALQMLVLKVLQPLRDKCGHALHVNSGYRSPELNKAVGGVATSQHVKGEAADIASDNPVKLAKLARNTPEIWAEIDQMIVYPTFVHFSHRLRGEQRHQLLYNKRYKGERV